MARLPVPGGGTTLAPNPQIASDAMQYQGSAYVYGGGSPTNGWDCSGFVNYVLGHDFGMKLPGAATAGFTGKTHGPAVLSYSAWSGAVTIPKAEVQAGDLCLWLGAGPNGHMGIATSNTKMISALNPALGTIVSPISGSGPAGAPLIYRRIKNAGAANSSSNTPAPTGCLPGTALIARFL
jgi:cell wall-associated NlpC family hydrolase